MLIRQLSLFPSEERFDPESFVSFVNSRNLPELVSSSAIETFNTVLNIGIQEKRVKSDVMNSMFFDNLKMRLLEEGVITTNDCIESIAGNVKKHFYAGDYIFVLSKDGSTQNNTKVTQAIERQTCDKIVIQIQYTIDDSWSDLIAIRFNYSEGGSTVFLYDVPFSSDVYSTNGITSSLDIETPKVTLKKFDENIVAND